MRKPGAIVPARLKNSGSLQRWGNRSGSGTAGAPYEVCGYYFVCHLLSDLTDQISAVKLPEILYFHDTNMPYEVSMMGEIVSEEFPELLTYEKQLTEWDIQNGALHWGRLVQENAGLRASINGKIMSVPKLFTTL